jgi:hypothetical protein
VTALFLTLGRSILGRAKGNDQSYTQYVSTARWTSVGSVAVGFHTCLCLSLRTLSAFTCMHTLSPYKELSVAQPPSHAEQESAAC